MVACLHIVTSKNPDSVFVPLFIFVSNLQRKNICPTFFSCITSGSGSSLFCWLSIFFRFWQAREQNNHYRLIVYFSVTSKVPTCETSSITGQKIIFVFTSSRTTRIYESGFLLVTTCRQATKCYAMFWNEWKIIISIFTFWGEVAENS